MSERVRRYRFGGTTVEVDPERRTVVTRFADGSEVIAAPNMDAESIARARGLGYLGGDESVVWQMTHWHDLLHSVIANAQGLPCSPVLWHAAHGRSQSDPAAAHREEATVLLVQRLLAPAGGLAAILREHAS